MAKLSRRSRRDCTANKSPHSMSATVNATTGSLPNTNMNKSGNILPK